MGSDLKVALEWVAKRGELGKINGPLLALLRLGLEEALSSNRRAWVLASGSTLLALLFTKLENQQTRLFAIWPTATLRAIGG